MSAEGGKSQRLPWVLLFPVVLVMQLGLAVTLPYMLERQMFEVIEDEELRYVQRFGRDLSDRSRYNGDRLYDVVFVESGIERAVYGFVAPEGGDLPGEARFSEAWIGGGAVDAIFDYALLLCYRIGFTSIFVIFAIVLLCTLSVHAVLDRQRRRYVFGDTDILQNAYARSITTVSLPAAFLVVSLPIVVPPLAIIGLIGLCGVSAGVFIVSMPKKT